MSMVEHSNIYNSLCDNYARSHARWLRFAGGEAQCAFEGAVTALLRPSMKMVDVACGTGTVARRLLKNVAGVVDLTLLDASAAMLDRCRDVPAKRIEARMERLPFPDDDFDLVTCAWGIETQLDPRKAMREFVRVTRPGGHVCLVFCADRPAASFVGRVLRHHIATSGRGAFLDYQTVLAHAHGAGARLVQMLHCSGPAAAMILHI